MNDFVPFRFPVVLGAAAAASALLLSGASLGGGCNLSCPPGAVLANDGCVESDPKNPDLNGGCNFPDGANLIQDLGSILDGGSASACGTVGAFGGSRDLDWYRFEIDSPGFVNVTASHQAPGGQPAPNFVIIVLQGDSCPAGLQVFGQASALCPFSTGAIELPAGAHTVIVTVGSFDEPLCDTDYVFTVDFTAGQFAVCGDETSGDCTQAHGGLGCDQFGCCETVCTFFSSCCEIAWDELCVDFAVDLCGLFIYECNSPSGAPANDCAEDALTLEVKEPQAFNNAVADTDGPVEFCTLNNDLWWKWQSQGTGEATISVTGTGLSPVVAVYELPASGAIIPSQLPSQFVGCATLPVDGGGAILTGIAAGEWFLFRVGSAGAGGVGDVEVQLAEDIFNTGGTQPVLFNGTATNLGLSSGDLGATFPQRWFATPFTVGNPGAGFDGWEVARMYAYGFTPDGVVNDTLDFIIWERTSLAVAPVDGDQLFVGSIPFPTPTDLPEGAPANESHQIPVTFEIAPGDYWLTVFASNDDPGVNSNFAWFVNPPNGIVNLDGDGDPFGWRSSFFPDPGFAFYQVAAIQPVAGSDPTTIYNTGFRIVGKPAVFEGEPTPCPADLNNDGVVDSADLGILLLNFGSPGLGDLNNDGTVDSADIGLLLLNFGDCPD